MKGLIPEEGAQGGYGAFAVHLNPDRPRIQDAASDSDSEEDEARQIFDRDFV